MTQPVRRLNLQVSPNIVNKEGMTAGSAHLFLPFQTGYWFQSGQLVAFAHSTIPQDRNLLFSGTKKPNTFQKDCCSCLY